MRTAPIALLLLLPACAPATGSLPSATPDDDDAISPDDDDTVDDDDDATPAPPALLINELMADNAGSVIDDLGAPSDWLELYNPGASALDLEGFTLSDDWDIPALHALPAGLSIPAGGHLLLWADGDPDGGEAHLPFRLAAEGEGVGVFTPEGESLDWVVFDAQSSDQALARLPDGGDEWQEMPRGTPGAPNALIEEVEIGLVIAGSVWSYYDRATEPFGSWHQPSFDDSDWQAGPAPLGYGDSQSTTIDYGGDSADKNPTALFRHAFELDADLLAGGLVGVVALRVDDGAAVYLGGTEILRSNLPDGEITWDTWAVSAISGSGETSFSEYDLPSGLLVAGENVLAAEVHQVGPTSSDLTFDLALVVRGWQPASAR